MDQPTPPPTDLDERLRTIVARAIDGLVVVDDTGSVVFLNPAAEGLLGRPSAELIGRPLGFPLAGDGAYEVDLISEGGAGRIAEMRAVAINWGERPAHLIALRDVTESHRVRAELRAAQSFSQAVLDSLSSHIAVLDEHGTIIAINTAWAAFARENGDPELRYTGPGCNYFHVCTGAAGPSADEASAALRGMRAVLAGTLPAFELEYPCHSPSEERWYQMRVVPLRGGLVVAHTNVTAQRRNAAAAAAAHRMHQDIAALDRERTAVEALSDSPARADEAAPLRTRDHQRFQQAVRAYRDLIEAALARRAFGSAPAADAQALGTSLGAWGATPRDVIMVHMAALRQISDDAPMTKVQIVLEEGRLLVLELMGYLARYYRAQALGEAG